MPIPFDKAEAFSDSRLHFFAGLIVLDISIVMNPQRMFVNGDSDEAIESEMHALFARFLDEFKSALGISPRQKNLGHFGVC